jgi:hypothetical protein
VSKQVFFSNTGIGPPIKAFSSIVNISHAVFGVSNVSKYGRAIFMLSSTINVVNATSISIADNCTSDDCDIYISVFSNDLIIESSCVNFENRSNISFPEIDFGKTCPTLKPSVSSAHVARTNIPTSLSPKTPIF